MQTLDYIDFDTKAFTFDADIPKTYMVSTSEAIPANLVYEDFMGQSALPCMTFFIH
jgi:hypothetical protein